MHLFIYPFIHLFIYVCLNNTITFPRGDHKVYIGICDKFCILTRTVWTFARRHIETWKILHTNSDYTPNIMLHVTSS